MKDRLIPCKFYICAGECKKGREASLKGYCQKCNLYKKDPHRVIPHEESKRHKLEKDLKKALKNGE